MANFLGAGFAFPLQVGGDGKFKVESGPDKIKSSIAAILSTPKGSRIMNRDFGCRIHEINFRNDEDVTASLAIFYVEEALAMWEPRITVNDGDVTVVFDGSTMWISIRYTINATNTEDNMVYPFYTKGGAAGGSN